ncbi:MAG: transposase [Deltaproteobacteria bacterium]|nr:transposase [Deltaproteobacteria bacterium]
MPRPYRIQYPGAIYHVMNRGQNRRPVFKDPDDYQYFLKLCQKSWERWALEIFAYCLMPNHYHLCLRTPQGNLSRIMRHLDGLYTQAFNRRHGRDGPLFRGRYKAILVEQEEYLSQLVRYIHLNPIKANLAVSPQDYAYSSHRSYLSLKKPPAWLNVNLVRDNFKGRKAFSQFINSSSEDGLSKILSAKRLPVILGTKDFVEKIKKLAPKPTQNHVRLQRQELRPSLSKIIQEMMKAYGVTKAKLVQGLRGQENEARKVAMWFAKEYGDLSHSQIAKVFQVKSPDTVGWSCRQIDKKKTANKDLQKRIKAISKAIVE